MLSHDSRPLHRQRRVEAATVGQVRQGVGTRLVAQLIRQRLEPQMREHTGAQQGFPHGLVNEVRRPDRESPQLGRFVVVGRDEEDGHVGKLRPQFEPFADLEAVDAVHFAHPAGSSPALPGRRP